MSCANLFILVFKSCEATVIAIRCKGQFIVDPIKSEQECGILLDRTSFYAEQGGQIYDEGFMNKIGDEVSSIFFKKLTMNCSCKQFG